MYYEKKPVNANLRVNRRRCDVFVATKAKSSNTEISVPAIRLANLPKNRMIIKDWGANRPGIIIPVCNLKDLQMIRRKYTIIDFKNRKE